MRRDGDIRFWGGFAVMPVRRGYRRGRASILSKGLGGTKLFGEYCMYFVVEKNRLSFFHSFYLAQDLKLRSLGQTMVYSTWLIM